MISKYSGVCYGCNQMRNVPGNAHVRCNVLKTLYPHSHQKMQLVMIAQIFNPDKKGIVEDDKGFLIEGDVHGIKNGWFGWPLLFDPVWLKYCRYWRDNDGFKV